MSYILSSNVRNIKTLLNVKKFKIDDALSAALIKSIIIKIFYVLVSKKVFETYEGPVKIGAITITPYRHLAKSIKYLIEINGIFADDKQVFVFWNGKFEKSNSVKEHSNFKTNIENLNIADNLDAFVNLEQDIINRLNDIQNVGFNVVKVEE